MGLFDTLWHVLNFFSPAVSMGILAPMLAKLLWRHRLKGVSGPALGLWVTGASALALWVGLVVHGRDGKMASYALMVLASALALWWAGLRARR